MKLLIITPIIPYPLDEGGKVSQFAFLEYLQNYITIHLALLPNNSADTENIITLNKLLPKIKIYTLDKITEKSIPIEKKKNLNIPFYKQLYWTFTDFIFRSKKTTVKPDPIKQSQTNDFDRNLDFFKSFKESTVNTLGELAHSINPDIIQIEHNPFLSFIEIFSNYKTIFVEHEIQFARLLSYKNKDLTFFEKYKIEYNRTIECSLLNKYTTVLTFSKDDQQILYNNGIKIPIEVSPFPIADKAFRKPANKEKQIKKIVFVGGNAHFPNHDAIKWYIENIAEAVYNKTKLKFHIIGKCHKNIIDKYNKYPYVVFGGYVEDLQTACLNSLMVVPLRMGSGIRTKILYGMAQQLPIISTNIGCEGLGTENNKNIIIANTAIEFTDKITELYNNAEIANKIAENGYKFVAEHFSQKKLSEKRLKIYYAVLNR